jgi:alpha-tubulin suppressor-like RCC1 family protein
LFAVGYNEEGSIGDCTTAECPLIKQIDRFENINIVDVVCGSYHCFSISNKGEIFAWGWNYFGKIGNGKKGLFEEQLIPMKIFKIK